MEYSVLHKKCSLLRLPLLYQITKGSSNGKKQKEQIEVRELVLNKTSLNLLFLEENPTEERKIHRNENTFIIPILVKHIFIFERP